MPGALVDMPLAKQTNVTFRRAPRAAAKASEPLELPLVHRAAKAEQAEKPARPARRKK